MNIGFFSSMIDEKMTAWVDITTYCNAACPQCHRTNRNGLGKADWLPLVQHDLSHFQKQYPIDTLHMFNSFEFCGSWGDPIMNKDILEICKYILDNSTAKILLFTNGGIRSKEWWTQLGQLGGKRIQCGFDIDGINQEMHNKYRRGVSLSKALENMRAFADAGGDTKCFIVVFKHNQEYVDDIIQLTKECGATSWSITPSDRFTIYEPSPWEFINENGEREYLEEADNKIKRFEFK
jgi:MoaA/NifB/PqqE/SkfB family radical SAM enzyme